MGAGVCGHSAMLRLSGGCKDVQEKLYRMHALKTGGARGTRVVGGASGGAQEGVYVARRCVPGVDECGGVEERVELTLGASPPQGQQGNPGSYGQTLCYEDHTATEACRTERGT